MSMYTDIHKKEKIYQTTIPRARDEVKSRSPRACILLASTALEPKEIQQPWEYLTNHGFYVEFATWDGKPAKPDPTLLEHFLFGSPWALQAKWKELVTLDDWLKPRAWAPVTKTKAPSLPALEEIGVAISEPADIPAEGQTQSTSQQSEQMNKPENDQLVLENYDLVLIPGGWAGREHLEHDTVLQDMLSKYCLHLPKAMGSKVLAVIGDGISPLLHVKNPLTQEPIMKSLTSTGPGYDSWTGLFTGKDLGSLIPGMVKAYVSKKVTIDPDNWYISSPSSNFNAEFNPALVTLVKGAIKVSELREQEKVNKRLTTVQSNQIQTAIAFDGLSKKQKERLNADGIGKADSGFVMTNWSWGWRNNYT